MTLEIDYDALTEDLAGLLSGDTCRELFTADRDGRVLSGIVENVDEAVSIITSRDGPTKVGWYVGKNPVSGAARPLSTSRPSGDDVPIITALLIDLDIHHKERAPSDDELARLRHARDRLFSQLVTMFGFPPELLRCGDTGNGVTMQWALPNLPNTPATDDLMKRATTAMAALVKNEFPDVDFDTSVTDAVRVRRLAGTINRRHADPAQWRPCELVIVNDAEPVSLEALETLANEAPRAEPRTSTRQDGVTLTLTEDEQTALVDVLKPGWKDGHRHSAGLAVPAMLWHMGVGYDQAFEIVSRLWGGDNKPGDRLKALDDTFDRAAAGKPVLWHPTLKAAMAPLQFEQLLAVRRAILKARGPEEAEAGDCEAGRSKLRKLGPALGIHSGAFVTFKQSDDELQPVPITNFTARIVKRITKDNGAERRSFFEIEAATQDGQIASAVIRTEDFAGMAWVTPELGIDYIVYAGSTNRDKVRQAILQASSDDGYEIQHIREHTGWIPDSDDHVFLAANGAIGPDGLRPDIATELPGKLAMVSFPDPDVSPALRSHALEYLRFLDVAPLRLSAPVFAMTPAAIMGPFRPVDFAVHLHGRTGTHKTELASLVQQTVGPGFGRNSLHSWSSTYNALNLVAFLAKDIPLIVDDFAPDGTSSDQGKARATFQLVTRAAGNQAGRSRMGADGSLKPDYAARGLIGSTGEDLPGGHSVSGRLLALEVSRGDIDLDVLTQLQRSAASGALARVTASVICWIAKHWETVARNHPRLVNEHLETLRSIPQAHSRHPDTLATLMAASQTWLDALQAMGAITESERDDALARCAHGITEAGTAQSDVIVDADPCRQFVGLISSALASEAAHLANADDNGEPRNSSLFGWRKGWAVIGGDDTPDNRPQGTKIGWVGPTGVYLIPDAALNVAQQMGRQQGKHIPWASKTLGKRLNEGGHLLTTEPGRNTQKVKVGGSYQRAWHVATDTLVHVAQAEDGTTDATNDNVRQFDPSRKETA